MTKADGEGRFSRAQLLRSAGLLGAAAVLPAGLSSNAAKAAPGDSAEAPVDEQLAAREAFVANEYDTLEAIAERLVPTDESGPGAVEAGAVIHIDRALNSYYDFMLDSYTTNLAAVDAYASSTFGAPFAELSAANQDSVLTAMQTGNVPASFGFEPSAASFFSTVLGHVQEGMFSDPYYGGNRNFIGWDLLGFPGIKLMYEAHEQDLDYEVPKTLVSSYSVNKGEFPAVANPGTPDEDRELTTVANPGTLNEDRELTS